MNFHWNFIMRSWFGENGGGKTNCNKKENLHVYIFAEILNNMQ